MPDLHPYPAWLPPPHSDGWQAQAAEGDIVRTDMDGGLARVRARPGRRPAVLQARWTVTPDQAAALTAWLSVIRADWGLMDGSAPGADAWRVRAVAPWQASRSGGMWQITCQLEGLPYTQSPYEDAHYRVIAHYGHAQLRAAARAVRWAAGHYPPTHYF